MTVVEDVGTHVVPVVTQSVNVDVVEEAGNEMVEVIVLVTKGNEMLVDMKVVVGIETQTADIVL